MPIAYKCKVTRLWESLEGDDKRIFQDAIHDVDKWSALALEKALIGRGLRVSNDAISLHRQKVCCCREERV
jgi:hypothetical protein